MLIQYLWGNRSKYEWMLQTSTVGNVSKWWQAKFQEEETLWGTRNKAGKDCVAGIYFLENWIDL